MIWKQLYHFRFRVLHTLPLRLPSSPSNGAGPGGGASASGVRLDNGFGNGGDDTTAVSNFAAHVGPHYLAVAGDDATPPAAAGGAAVANAHQGNNRDNGNGPAAEGDGGEMDTEAAARVSDSRRRREEEEVQEQRMLALRVQKEELEDEAMQRLKYASSGPHAGPYHPAYVPYKVRFHQRLLDPRVGDRVEVAWRGKFRLEALDIYQGLAWWVAVVVEKETPAEANGRGDPGDVCARYKIHYPGWVSRWDEWVHRNRLRWATEANEFSQIRVHDDVEIWCCGECAVTSRAEHC